MASSADWVKALPFLAVGRVKDAVTLASYIDTQTLDPQWDMEDMFKKLLAAARQKLKPGQRTRLRWYDGSFCCLMDQQGQLLYCVVTSFMEYPESSAYQLLKENMAAVQALGGHDDVPKNGLNEALQNKMQELLAKYEDPGVDQQDSKAKDGVLSHQQVVASEGSSDRQDIDVSIPVQVSCYMQMDMNAILNHGRTNGEQSVEKQWLTVSKVDALSCEYAPPSLTHKATGSHLTMGITLEGAMRFIQRIGFPKRYRRNEETLGYVTQLYGTELTGYDFADAIRAWLDGNGHADKSVCEALAQEGDEDVGPAHTFLSHVQSQSLDATLRSMALAPYLSGGLHKHKAHMSDTDEEQVGDSDASKLQEEKFIANKLELEGNHRVYVSMRASRAEDEPFEVYAPRAFAEAAKGLGKKLLWNHVGAVMPSGEFIAWPTSGESGDDSDPEQTKVLEAFDKTISSDNKASWWVNGVVIDGNYNSLIDDCGFYDCDESIFGNHGTSFTVVFERTASPRFWVDYFCLQHSDFNLDQILNAISEIGSMVVDLDSLPMNYLSRSFCVFESFAACQTKCELLCLISNNISGSTDTMAEKGREIMEETYKVEVNCKAAQARFEEDQAKISAYIDTIGEEVVNNTVKAAMNYGSKMCYKILCEIDH